MAVVDGRLRQRHRQRHPELVPDAAGDVAVAGQILGDQHIAGEHSHFGAVGHLKLGDAAEVDHILLVGGYPAHDTMWVCVRRCNDMSCVLRASHEYVVEWLGKLRS